jgi:beta-lactamase superfamily II metal-dependent hydrolase
MDVITLYVGQGALAVARNSGEAIILDSHFPGTPPDLEDQIERQLDGVLRSHSVPGLILTGFDADHCCPAGVDLILDKYRPNWVMYPTYFKDTDCAHETFNIIERHRRKRESTSMALRRVSVRLDNLGSRLLVGLSANFSYELFSPHIEDMDNSNNSSIVMKLTGVGGFGFSYLITGDTESPRWDTINRLFGNSLKSDVMAAPHHGARSGANAETVLAIEPNTVLISAGVDSQYGHPHSDAVAVYGRVAKHVFATNVEGGVSLQTKRHQNDFRTLLFR